MRAVGAAVGVLLLAFGRVAAGRPFTRRDDFDFVLLWGGLPLRVLQGSVFLLFLYSLPTTHCPLPNPVSPNYKIPANSF